MKKALCVTSIIMFMMLCVGCGKDTVTLDLAKIKEELPNLSGENFEPSMATTIIEDPELDAIFGEMEDIYDFDFEEVFGIHAENIESYTVRKSNINEDIYMILKPMDGKKDTVKEEVNAYFEKSSEGVSEAVKKKYENRLQEEYQGYLIYIVSNNNAEVLNRMKSSKAPVFGAMMEVEADLLNSTFNIDANDLEEYQIYMPLMIVSSKSYYILKPKEDKYDTVKEKMDEYMKNFETQWSTYLPDQYELVKNRMVKEYGGYLIYIISDDNDTVFKKIEANKK